MKNPHGGDILSYKKQYGETPLDFSASLNPMGMPGGVKNAVIDAFDDAYFYPDPYSRHLSNVLADSLRICPEQLIFGNGSAELMYLFAAACRPRKALLPVPSFSEYEGALKAAGCEIIYYELSAKNSFRLDGKILDEIEGSDVLFLCQPNNPTGQLIDGKLLDDVIEKCASCGTRLFLDECFLDFVPNGKSLSKKIKISKYPLLFILGSFTKLYGMAGLRLGFGISGDRAFIDRMEECRQPWSVSSLAQAAGLAAIGETEYVDHSLKLIEKEKAFLKKELLSLGISSAMGEANYLFFYISEINLASALAKNGILIRDCRAFRGLGQGYYRIAIRTRSENERLIELIREVING